MPSAPILSRQHSAPSDFSGNPSQATGFEELGFWGDESDRWQLRLEVAGQELADSLEQAVAAFPTALEWSIRRINFAYDHQHGNELYAALLDLLIVLNGRGRALQWRMLAGARDRLSPQDFDALEAIVRRGSIRSERELRRVPESRLLQGIEGVLNLVAVASTREHVLRDPLLEAQEHIEYSQLDAARELLEAAIMEDTKRADLQQELLSLYRATGDVINFSRMREQLQRSLGSLPAAWADLHLPNSGGKSS